MFLKCLLVAIGGAVGSLLRFLVSVSCSTLNVTYPIATVIVNLLGSVAIGAISGWGGPRGLLTEHLKLLIFTGIMGGFTTFSAFAAETVQLSRGDLNSYAFLHIALHFVICLGGAFVGFRLGSAI